jgi:hypothetical protein
MSLTGIQKFELALSGGPQRIQAAEDVSATLVLLAAVRAALATHLLDTDPSAQVHGLPIDVLAGRVGGVSATLAENIQKSVWAVEQNVKLVEYEDGEHLTDASWLSEADKTLRLLHFRLRKLLRSLGAP